MLCMPRLELTEVASLLLRRGEAGEVWLCWELWLRFGVELGVKPGYKARLGSAQGIVSSDFLSVKDWGAAGLVVWDSPVCCGAGLLGPLLVLLTLLSSPD